MLKQYLKTGTFCIVVVLLQVSPVCFAIQKEDDRTLNAEEPISQRVPSGKCSHPYKAMPKAQVRLSYEVLKGSRTEQELKTDIFRNLATTRYKWHKIKREHPEHSGTMKFHLTINESGQVQTAIVKESSFTDETLNDTIASSVGRWAFQVNKELSETPVEILVKLIFE